MKTPSRLHRDPKDEQTFDPEHANVESLHKDYEYEGDEFLDDGRRMTEQEFDQSNN
mgnify:CR=1 FL=1